MSFWSGLWKGTKFVGRQVAFWRWSEERKFVTISMAELVALEYVRYHLDPGVRVLGRKTDEAFNLLHKISSSIENGAKILKKKHEELTSEIGGALFRLFNGTQEGVEEGRRDGLAEIGRETTNLIATTRVAAPYEWIPHLPRADETYELAFANYLNVLVKLVEIILLYPNLKSYVRGKVQRKKVSEEVKKQMDSLQAEIKKQLRAHREELEKEFGTKIQQLESIIELRTQKMDELLAQLEEMKNEVSALEKEARTVAAIEVRKELPAHQKEFDELQEKMREMEKNLNLQSKLLSKVASLATLIAKNGAKRMIAGEQLEEQSKQKD